MPELVLHALGGKEKKWIKLELWFFFIYIKFVIGCDLINKTKYIFVITIA